MSCTLHCCRGLASRLPLFLRSLSTSLYGEGSTDFEVAVIGAGAVGLSIARRLSLAGKDVVLLESCSTFGTQTSSRNSEVIHAGIYYPPRSLKANLCFQGREQLYRYCREAGVSHQRLGKLIVATDEDQIVQLRRLRSNAERNGVKDLSWLSGDEASLKQPGLRCRAALFSPSTGIVDSHQYMSSLQADFVNTGGTIAYNSMVVGGECSSKTGTYGHHTLIVRTVDPARHSHAETLRMPGQGKKSEWDFDSSTDTKVSVSKIVNAGGLFAQEISRHMKGFPSHTIPELYLAKGNYFTLRTGAIPNVNRRVANDDRASSKEKYGEDLKEVRPEPLTAHHLIYPIPSSGGLGVHMTVDLSGSIKFGPDVEWLSSNTHPSDIDYRVDGHRSALFEDSIRKWLPDLQPGSLEPDYSGVRPKVVPPGTLPADFVVSGPKDHGINGFVALYGIESPGLTASLALADMVEERLRESGS